jgi:hypothetical protein
MDGRGSHPHADSISFVSKLLRKNTGEKISAEEKRRDTLNFRRNEITAKDTECRVDLHRPVNSFFQEKAGIMCNAHPNESCTSYEERGGEM